MSSNDWGAAEPYCSADEAGAGMAMPGSTQHAETSLWYHAQAGLYMD